ncbi:MAG: hypothetical protein HY820_10685 [Acidobacteria bacterium]|nr:hypothetical protein [Acidobacteriota bacterium]
MGLLWILTFLLPCYAAEPLQIYTEFRRLDVKGNVVAADAEGKPREVLSPGLIRGGYHSLRIVVRPPRNGHYAMMLAQNPENSIQMKLYRELPPAPGVSVPDKLDLVTKSPFEWDGAAVHVFWLDLFTPADAKVQRVRIEAQVHDGNGWIIYPMEVRVLAGIVPRVRTNGVQAPPPAASSDTAARLALREYLCEEKPRTTPAGVNARSFIYRNAQQDVALARSLQLKWTREKLTERLAQTAGAETGAAFCASQSPIPSPMGPEWYLKVRDFLYREASH